MSTTRRDAQNSANIPYASLIRIIKINIYPSHYINVSYISTNVSMVNNSTACHIQKMTSLTVTGLPNI